MYRVEFFMPTFCAWFSFPLEASEIDAVEIARNVHQRNSVPVRLVQVPSREVIWSDPNTAITELVKRLRGGGNVSNN